MHNAPAEGADCLHELARLEAKGELTPEAREAHARKAAAHDADADALEQRRHKCGRLEVRVAWVYNPAVDPLRTGCPYKGKKPNELHVSVVRSGSMALHARQSTLAAASLYWPVGQAKQFFLSSS